MAKVRFTIDDKGLLVSRDGRVLGRLTSLTIDDAGGTIGGGVDFPAVAKEEETPPVVPEEMRQVWDHYVKLFDAGRQTLNPTRKRDIQRALKVRPIDVVLRAIEGLRVSPHHNGENDRGETYLDIRYALRGNAQRGESPEERIDKMAAHALDYADESEKSVLSDARISILKDEVEQALEFSTNTAIVERGRRAKLELEAAGYKLSRQGNKVRVTR